MRSTPGTPRTVQKRDSKKINWFLRFADLQIKSDEFVEAAT
jgi:hypothetical protein